MDIRSTGTHSAAARTNISEATTGKTWAAEYVRRGSTPPGRSVVNANPPSAAYQQSGPGQATPLRVNGLTHCQLARHELWQDVRENMPWVNVFTRVDLCESTLANGLGSGGGDP